MSEIKSEKAKEWIISNTLSKKFNDGQLHPCVRAETAVLVIHYAETELTERHAKELQAVHDMYKQIFIEHHREYECNHEIALQELKDKAVEAFKKCCHYRQHILCADLDHRSNECNSNCGRIQDFMNELTTMP